MRWDFPRFPMEFNSVGYGTVDTVYLVHVFVTFLRLCGLLT
jgi:hypothetical protein